VKCYEVQKCSQEEREACYVWNSFRDNPQDMDNVKCWVLKGAYQEESGQQLKQCKQCAYFITMNRETGIVSDSDADVAVVTCEGTINTERTKALEKCGKTCGSTTASRSSSISRASITFIRAGSGHHQNPQGGACCKRPARGGGYRRVRHQPFHRDQAFPSSPYCQEPPRCARHLRLA